MNRIKSLLANPHTTWAGILAILIQVAEIWAPAEYDAKLDKTSVLLVSYAAIMGADAKKKPQENDETPPPNPPSPPPNP